MTGSFVQTLQTHTDGGSRKTKKQNKRSPFEKALLIQHMLDGKEKNNKK